MPAPLKWRWAAGLLPLLVLLPPPCCRRPAAAALLPPPCCRRRRCCCCCCCCCCFCPLTAAARLPAPPPNPTPPPQVQKGGQASARLVELSQPYIVRRTANVLAQYLPAKLTTVGGGGAGGLIWVGVEGLCTPGAEAVPALLRMCWRSTCQPS